MQFSIAKDIFGSPWHIDASGIQRYFPIVAGMLNGAVVADENEPGENLPYHISAKTGIPVLWSQPEEDLDEEPADEEESQKEKVIHVLPVRGIMMKHDMVCGPAGTRTLARRLSEADGQDSVIGHILIFEGPGGAANAVPELADAIKDCKKPVLGWVDGMAASAHQYVLSYCTEKWASRPTDIVGSIGTMLMFSGRISKSDENLFKERQVTIYADAAFEKNEEYEKAINDFDFKLAKERILNPHNQQFVNDILNNCPGVKDNHLHGRTFQAAEVVGALIDTIGNFDEAVKRVVALGTAQSQNLQQKNKGTMDQFSRLNTVLGVESLESVDESVSLNADQLEMVDTALANAETVTAERDTALQQVTTLTTERDNALEQVTNLTTERDEAVSANATATEQVNSLTGERDAANAALTELDTIDTTIAAAATPAEKVAAIRSLLAAKPGFIPVATLDDEDSEAAANDVDWNTIDNLEHNKNV